MLNKLKEKMFEAVYKAKHGELHFDASKALHAAGWLMSLADIVASRNPKKFIRFFRNRFIARIMWKIASKILYR